MITKEQVPQVVGRPAFDLSHHKVGDVGQVYVDTETGEPEWMTIRTGLLGTKETFVPLRSAELHGDEVLVPFGADRIKHAPRVTTRDGELPASEEARLYDYYGLPYRPYESGGQAGAEATGESLAPDVGVPGGGAAAGYAIPPRQGEGSAVDLPEHTTGEGMAPGADVGDEAQERAAFDTDAPIRARYEPEAGADYQSMIRSEERLLVGKKWQEIGRARLHKYVVTEEQEQTIPVREERVKVTYEPISESEREQLHTTPTIGESDSEVVLRAEQPVVETETVPVERVRLDKETVVRDETVTKPVRKERIEVEGVEEEETDL